MGALNKTITNPTQPSRCPYQDSNTAPPQYNSQALLLAAACLATVKFVGPFVKVMSKSSSFWACFLLKRRLMRSKAVCAYPLVLLLLLSDKFTELRRVRYGSGWLTTLYFLFLNSVTWNDNSEAARNPSLAFGMMVINSDAVKAPADFRARKEPRGGPQTHRLRKLIGECV